MPIYEFHCEGCGADFEQLFRSADQKRAVRCPTCGSRKASRKLSLFGMSSTGSDGTRRAASSSCASCKASSCAGCRQ